MLYNSHNPHIGGEQVEIEIWQFLIVCPLVFVAGFVDAVAGGGGLISLPSYMIAGLPVHYSMATNKLSSAMGTTIATARYAKNGYIPWKQAIFCVGCALAGSAMGAKLALMVNDHYFKIIMLVILPITAVYVTRSKKLSEDSKELPFWRSTALVMAIALGVGVYDGFYGPGTGTFLILFLTGVAGMELSKANGISKVINLSTDIAALTVYLLNDKVIIALGLAAGGFSIAGNYLGTRLFDKGGAKVAKPIMILVLAIFFIKVITELIG